jgi:hypothetical protein
MLGQLRKHSATVIVAFITAAVTAGTPALAGVFAEYAKNSDKVDGVHAVRASASLRDAAGRLVAHNGSGVIPKRFLPRVGDADTLDGQDSTDFYSAGSKVDDSAHAEDADTVGGLTPAQLGSGPTVSAGTCSMSSGPASGTCSFNATFTSPPTVVFSPMMGDTAAANINSYMWWIDTVTGTGFTLHVPNGTNGIPVKINWVAVGQ